MELTRGERLLRLAVRLAFILDLIFIIAMTGLVFYGLGHLWVFSDRGNLWFHFVQAIGVLGTIGTLVVLYNAVRSWQDKRKRIWGKAQATILALAALGFTWFAFAGNLLHFSSNY